MRDDYADGLAPRDRSDSDPVPLTPDVDLRDPAQRSAWTRANNEERLAREVDAQAQRDRANARRRRDDAYDDGDDDGPIVARPGTTTAVTVRFLHAEQRALLYTARRTSLTVSDLVRRWVRAGLDAEQRTERDLDAEWVRTDPDRTDEERERLAAEREVRRATLAAADAAVERITDELRRLRELVAHTG